MPSQPSPPNRMGGRVRPCTSWLFAERSVRVKRRMTGAHLISGLLSRLIEYPLAERLDRHPVEPEIAACADLFDADGHGFMPVARRDRPAVCNERYLG